MTTLRHATPDDAPAIAALEAEIFAGEAWSSRLVEDLFAPDHQFVLVSDTPAGPDGYAVLSVAGDTADLQRIAVAPPTRRTGVATALLAAGTAEVRQRGAEQLLLEVSAANAAARAFYDRAGFTPLHTRTGYYADGTDALVLRLPLTPGSH